MNLSHTHKDNMQESIPAKYSPHKENDLSAQPLRALISFLQSQTGMGKQRDSSI